MEKRVDGVKMGEGAAESDDDDEEPSVGLEREMMLDIAVGAWTAAVVG